MADGEHHIDQLPGPLNMTNTRVLSYFKLPCPQCDPDPTKYFSTEPLDAATDCRSNLYILTPDRVVKYLSPAGTSARTCPAPPRILETLAISFLPKRTRHGIAITADCLAAKCAGSLEVSAHAANCKKH